MDSEQETVDSGQRAAGSQQWGGSEQWTLNSRKCTVGRGRVSPAPDFNLAKFWIREISAKFRAIQNLKFSEFSLASLSGTLAMAVTLCARTVIEWKSGESSTSPSTNNCLFKYNIVLHLMFPHGKDRIELNEIPVKFDPQCHIWHCTAVPYIMGTTIMFPIQEDVDDGHFHRWIIAQQFRRHVRQPFLPWLGILSRRSHCMGCLYTCFSYPPPIANIYSSPRPSIPFLSLCIYFTLYLSIFLHFSSFSRFISHFPLFFQRLFSKRHQLVLAGRDPVFQYRYVPYSTHPWRVKEAALYPYSVRIRERKGGVGLVEV